MKEINLKEIALAMSAAHLKAPVRSADGGIGMVAIAMALNNVSDSLDKLGKMLSKT